VRIAFGQAISAKFAAAAARALRPPSPGCAEFTKTACLLHKIDHAVQQTASKTQPAPPATSQNTAHATGTNYRYLPSEDVFGTRLNSWQIRRVVKKRPEILRVKEKSRFTLNPLSKGQTQLYTVRKLNDGWTVRLVSKDK